MSLLTLKVRGRFLKLCADTKESVEHKVFDFKNALADAGIIAGLTAVTTYGSSIAVGVPDIDALKTAVVAGLSQFFIFLALKRGLAKEVVEVK